MRGPNFGTSSYPGVMSEVIEDATRPETVHRPVGNLGLIHRANPQTTAKIGSQRIFCPHPSLRSVAAALEQSPRP